MSADAVVARMTFNRHWSPIVLTRYPKRSNRCQNATREKCSVLDKDSFLTECQMDGIIYYRGEGKRLEVYFLRRNNTRDVDDYLMRKWKWNWICIFQSVNSLSLSRRTPLNVSLKEESDILGPLTQLFASRREVVMSFDENHSPSKDRVNRAGGNRWTNRTDTVSDDRCWSSLEHHVWH